MPLRFFFIKMFIGKSFSNKPDRAWISAKLGSNRTIGHGFGHLQNLSCLFVCKFPYGYYLPSLGLHISPVIAFRTKKQMIFSANAKRIVTAVKHAKILWNNSAVNQPRYAMSRNTSASQTPQSTSATGSDSSVTKYIRSSGPHPALPKFWKAFRNWSVFVYLFPEANKDVVGKALRDKKRERRVCVHARVLSLVEIVCRLLDRQIAGALFF